jgi:predicted ATPase
MIRTITFCVNHWTKIEMMDGGRHNQLHFAPGYNALVGPNGAGKTSVLEAIADCSLCKKDQSQRHEAKFITSESLNPLTGVKLNTREEMILAIRALFSSHGEVVRQTLEHQRYAGEDCILIDTPETGQDIEQSQVIHDRLKQVCDKHGVQLIVATHSPVFLRNADKIVELEERYLGKLVALNQEVLSDLAAPSSVSNR